MYDNCSIESGGGIVDPYSCTISSFYVTWDNISSKHTVI